MSCTREKIIKLIPHSLPNIPATCLLTGLVLVDDTLLNENASKTQHEATERGEAAF